MPETQKTKVLRRLQQAGARGVHTSEFLADVEIGSRFSARIKELRDDGKTIETVPTRGGAKYVLREYAFRSLDGSGKQLFQTRQPDELVAWVGLYGVEGFRFERKREGGIWEPLPSFWVDRLRDRGMARRAELDARRALEENAAAGGQGGDAA